jgi:hypothetical protein
LGAAYVAELATVSGRKRKKLVISTERLDGVILQPIGPAAMVTARASGKASSSANHVLITSSLWEIDFDQDVIN